MCLCPLGGTGLRYWTTLRAGWSGIRNLVRARDFSLLYGLPDRLWSTPSLLFNGSVFFHKGKAAGGVKVATHHHIVHRLRKSACYQNINLTSSCYAPT